MAEQKERTGNCHLLILSNLNPNTFFYLIKTDVLNLFM
jgi:hypothetical protein